jgi:hypothetical protein
MAKRNECLVLLVEEIDHTVRNVVFECLILNVYGNLSISSTSPFKSMAFSYIFMQTSLILWVSPQSPLASRRLG